jgi:hypothetical protein
MVFSLSRFRSDPLVTEHPLPRHVKDLDISTIVGVLIKIVFIDMW